MSRTHVLLIDEDEEGSQALAGFLGDFGFEVSCADAEAAARALLARQTVDLVVLDVAMSRCNGLGLLQDIRRSLGIAVVVLSRRTEPTDRIVGLELGADDYIAKPCEPRELLARMRAILRRQSGAAAAGRAPERTVRLGRWELRRDERRLVAGHGESVALSASEFRLLCAFLAAPRTVLSRQQLMAQARGREMRSLDRGIDLLVSRLRRKLDDDGAPRPLIRTVRGCGYVYEPLPASPQSMAFAVARQAMPSPPLPPLLPAQAPHAGHADRHALA